MTIVPLGPSGLIEIASALRSGDAVVIPFPSPLPYAVAAVRSAAVNEAKGRPGEQPAGMLIADPSSWQPYVDLGGANLDLLTWIGEVERASLMVPVRSPAPTEWLPGGVVDGLVGLTLAWLDQMRPLASGFGHLFVSSANRTSKPPALTARSADEMFDGRRLVLDGDAVRDRDRPHGSATIVRMAPDGGLRLVRSGVQDRALGGDAAAYLASLRNRFARDWNRR